MAERVAENLNRGLAEALDRDSELYLLGEDIVDPYGGAFKVTKGLSTRHPDRVLSTPISEGAMVGLANGLALCGAKAIVEIMFADFVTLAFDQIVNFSAKSVTMYGRDRPMPVIVRCPTGGGRGYGPTHSQSLQKHFIGVPGLAVYELSPFLDSADLLGRVLENGRPAMLFEDKMLYGQRMYRHGHIDDLAGYHMVDQDCGTAVISLKGDAGPADCVILAPAGLSARVLSAMRTLFLHHELSCRAVVPARLHPFSVDPLLELLGTAGLVCTVEDSSAGGTWGAEVASQVQRRLWGQLRRPVLTLSAADTVIPSAMHLERAVLLQPEDICDRIVEALHA